MTPQLVANCGTTGKHSVMVYRRPAVPQDGYHGATVLAVTVVEGAATLEAVVFDDGAEAPRFARLAGLGIVAALKQYGA